MNNRVRMSIVAATLAAAVGGSVLTGTAAIAAPPSSGCPRGFQVLSVQTLTAEGYKVPALIDDPTSGVVGQVGQGNGKAWIGQPGNDDGWVCGRQLGNQLNSSGLPLFLFFDNQLPA
jgi:hypothetical protein